MNTDRPDSDDEGFDPTKSMELVWQGQDGNAGAVNELFTRYIPRMRRVVKVKIPPGLRHRIETEDILQETLAVASRRLPELEVRSPSSILNWLAQIADFKIKERKDYLQAERRDPAREQRLASSEDSDSGGLRLASSDPTPSQEFARHEMEERIDRELQRLEPPAYREVILQRDYYEMDWETIRCNLDRPTIEAAQDVYRRAKKLLAERLGFMP